MSEQNDFTWWEDALAGKPVGIDVNTPATGYFRTKTRRGGEFVPVAFWHKDGELRCRLGGVEVSAERALELWPWASKNPVSYEDYTAKIETGKWPGDHEAVVGHNAAPPDDSLEAISERINDLSREALAMIEAGAAASDATSDQASDLANTLGELETKADRLRVAEKEPHLSASRTVDGKWNPLRDKAADFKRRLKAVVVTPWLRKKSDEARVASVAAITSGAAPETIAQPRLTAGSSKRATALRTHTLAEVTDWDVLITALKAHPDVREAAQRIANASAKAGVELPGMKIIKTQVAA